VAQKSKLLYCVNSLLFFEPPCSRGVEFTDTQARVCIQIWAKLRRGNAISYQRGRGRSHRCQCILSSLGTKSGLFLACEICAHAWMFFPTKFCFSVEKLWERT